MRGEIFFDLFSKAQESLPENYKILLILAIFTTVIVLYSVFIFYFYKFLSRKNILKLDLNRFNTYEHAIAVKFFAFIFYVIEYLIILPILSFFWFAILAVFLLVISKAESVLTILTISASLVAAVRISSYINQDLSNDLAKMLPLALLAFFIVEPTFFSFELLIGRFQTIPSLLKHIPYYLIFTVTIELLMRGADLLGKTLTFGQPDDRPEEEPEKQQNQEVKEK